MVTLLMFLLLYVAVAVACIAGWSADSRDPRFALWPLNHSFGPAPRRADLVRNTTRGLREAAHRRHRVEGVRRQ